MLLLICIIALLMGSAWFSLVADQHKYYGKGREPKKSRRLAKHSGENWELTSVNVYTREMIKISWDQYFSQNY